MDVDTLLSNANFHAHIKFLLTIQCIVVLLMWPLEVTQMDITLKVYTHVMGFQLAHIKLNKALTYID